MHKLWGNSINVVHLRGNEEEQQREEDEDFLFIVFPFLCICFHSNTCNRLSYKV